MQERLGSPEGELAVAQAIVYLACAAKSNAVYRLQGGPGGRAARRDRGGAAAPAQRAHALMKDMGTATDTATPTTSPDAYAAGENYFPEALRDRRRYEPG